jgi:general secretion pathway protein J
LLIHLDDLQHGAIQEAWFRSTTTGIVTDYYDGKNIFQGQEREFSGLTLSPLEANSGSLSPFAWQLQSEAGRTSLRYRKMDGEYWEVASWTGEPGTFRYMDTEGKWYTQWPPPFFTKTPPQIPSFILLEAQRRQTAMTWIVPLTDRNEARFDNRGKD